MDQVLCEINWGYVIAILSLLVSLVLSISTIIITNNIAKKERLVDVITSNRIEWIQKLKDYVSKYISMVSYHFERKIPDNTSEFISDLYEITAQIKLHLNFKGDADNQIAKQLDDINMAFEKFFFLKNSRGQLENNPFSFNLIDFYLDQYPDLFRELYEGLIDDYQINAKDIDSLNKKNRSAKEQPLKKLKFFIKSRLILLIGI